MADKIIIAIDGYSACGKSTIAKALAAKLGYSFVDSGAMYRCVTLYALRNNAINDKQCDKDAIIALLPNIEISFRFNPKTNSSDTYLNGENVEKEIREMPVAQNVSNVSTIHEVRVQMVDLQRKFGEQKGIVMDGRDIGSNVFPDAELKLFMTADTDIRVQRRLDEYIVKNEDISFEIIKENLQKRDHDDINRKENPLIQAEDAIILDNSNLTKEEQLNYVLDLIEEL